MKLYYNKFILNTFKTDGNLNLVSVSVCNGLKISKRNHFNICVILIVTCPRIQSLLLDKTEADRKEPFFFFKSKTKFKVKEKMIP